MKCIISRSYNKSETLGAFMIMEGERPVYSCKCIELPDNGNQVNTSCIPEGTYNVEKITHQTKGRCFRVLDVPGRTGILIHRGNYATGSHVDTLGCILPGQYFVDLNSDGTLDVAESTKAMEKLLEILPEKFKLYIL
jgi:hypothetical protein